MLNFFIIFGENNCIIHLQCHNAVVLDERTRIHLGARESHVFDERLAQHRVPQICSMADATQALLDLHDFVLGSWIGLDSRQMGLGDVA